jgi:hypothetical protein
MVCEGNLGVGDDGGREKGMGGIAEAALYPADGQWDLPQRGLHIAGIASMPHKAAEVAAGTFKVAELDGIHGVIIKFL